MRTLIVLLMLVGVAWGDTMNLPTNNEELEAWHFPPMEVDCPDGDCNDDALPGDSYIMLDVKSGDHSDSDIVISPTEIRDVLERALEFIRDNSDRNLFSVSTDLMYIPERDNPNRLDIARREAEAAKAGVERLERETQLRRDIERLLEGME